MLDELFQDIKNELILIQPDGKEVIDVDPTPDQLITENLLHVQEWFANVLVRT